LGSPSECGIEHPGFIGHGDSKVLKDLRIIEAKEHERKYTYNSVKEDLFI
jgi:hypothetical protein